MKILITGGAGFIGSNFTRYILDNCSDIEIINLDLFTYAGRYANIKDFKLYPNYKFIKSNINNKNKIDIILKEYDIELIINFAAETHVDRSIYNASNFIHTNIAGTYNLLESARKNDKIKFIQISTDEVYGSAKERSFNEEDSLNPSSPYSASKASADLIVRSFHKTYGLNINIIRSTNNFGPYQYPEKLVPKMILRALFNKTLPLYGDGMQIRDWLYVLDTCEAIFLVINKGIPNEIYNIASNNECTNLDIARKILKVLNKPENLIKFVNNRPGHDQRYSLQTEKIENLGWKARHSFDASLNETINWYITNESWWKPLLKDIFFLSDAPSFIEKVKVKEVL